MSCFGRFFNKLLGLNGPIDPAELDRMEAFFRTRGAATEIDLCPYAHPSLLDQLSRRGYAVAEFNSVLVRPLEGAAPYPRDPRLTECGPEETDIWSKTVATAFFERPVLTEDEAEAGQAIFHAPGARCFLAREAPNGVPAAGAAMSIHDNLALLFGDGTLPRYRNAGLQAALIRARLNAAIQAGCDLAAATTLSGSVSQRNYERHGFQVAYTRVGITA